MSFRSPTKVLAASWRRDLWLVAAGRAISLLGDEVAVIALLLAASRPTGGPSGSGGGGVPMVAAILIAAALPAIVLAPVSGLMADRLSARRLVAVVSSLQAATCVALAMTSSSVAVVSLVLVLNAGQTVVSPAWQALLPNIVPRDRLAGALSVVQTATASAGLIGPVVGGALVGLGGTSTALLVNALTFVALAIAALLLNGDRSPNARESSGGALWDQSLAGVRLICSDPVLRSLVILIGGFVLGLGAVNVAEIFLITDVLGASAFAYGMVSALFALGMMSGAYAARRSYDDLGIARRIVLASSVIVGSITLLALSPSLPAAAVASAAVGIGNGMLNVRAQQLIIRRSVQAALGRVFAALAAVVNTCMLVALGLGGTLLTFLDVRGLILLTAGATAFTLALTTRPLLRASRDLVSPRAVEAMPEPQPHG